MLKKFVGKVTGALIETVTEIHIDYVEKKEIKKAQAAERKEIARQIHKIQTEIKKLDSDYEKKEKQLMKRILYLSKKEDSLFTGKRRRIELRLEYESLSEELNRIESSYKEKRSKQVGLLCNIDACCDIPDGLLDEYTKPQNKPESQRILETDNETDYENEYVDNFNGWDNKQENGMNVTENKLYNAMFKIGLQPECQYPISYMTVDFAFPDYMVVVEINGPYHKSEEQKMIDKKRWFVLNSNGWKRRTYSADAVYKNPSGVARRIQKYLDNLY